MPGLFSSKPWESKCVGVVGVVGGHCLMVFRIPVTELNGTALALAALLGRWWAQLRRAVSDTQNARFIPGLLSLPQVCQACAGWTGHMLPYVAIAGVILNPFLMLLVPHEVCREMCWPQDFKRKKARKEVEARKARAKKEWTPSHRGSVNYGARWSQVEPGETLAMTSYRSEKGRFEAVDAGGHWGQSLACLNGALVHQILTETYWNRFFQLKFSCGSNSKLGGHFRLAR